MSQAQAEVVFKYDTEAISLLRKIFQIALHLENGRPLVTGFPVSEIPDFGKLNPQFVIVIRLLLKWSF